MQLDLNQPVTGYDLASLLEGDSGTYLAQNSGQSFIVVSSSGHSIKSLRPVAQPTGQDLWTVTKISSRDITEEAGSGQEQREHARAAGRSQQNV